MATLSLRVSSRTWGCGRVAVFGRSFETRRERRLKDIVLEMLFLNLCLLLRYKNIQKKSDVSLSPFQIFKSTKNNKKSCVIFCKIFSVQSLYFVLIVKSIERVGWKLLTSLISHWKHWHWNQKFYYSISSNLSTINIRAKH